jgi:hypothetical protein
MNADGITPEDLVLFRNLLTIGVIEIFILALILIFRKIFGSEEFVEFLQDGHRKYKYLPKFFIFCLIISFIVSIFHGLVFVRFLIYYMFISTTLGLLLSLFVIGVWFTGQK